MDKKYWEFFIIAVIILGSLYLNYCQYYENKHYKNEIINQQRNILRKAYWEIDNIVADGYRALATAHRDKAEEYLLSFNEGQRILNRYILRRPLPGNLRKFDEVEEQEAIREKSRRYEEEQEAIRKAFEPEALRIARDFMGEDLEGFEELGVTGYGNAPREGTRLSVEFRKGKIIKDVDVTTDGYISRYRTEYYNPGEGSSDLPVQKENLTDEEAVERAEEFLAERLGIGNVYLESSGRTPEGLLQVYFKETADGIIIGRSQIEMTVSLEDGTVFELFRAINTPEESERIREAISTPPTITREQAKGLIGKHNSMTSEGELYYRYDDILTWRFEVSTSGIRMLIYIDAHTGEEVEIMPIERI